MTREEAITNLNMISVAFVEPVTKEQRKLIDDTFEMAIQALSQEPCELLIIKSDILLHQDDRKKWVESIKREKESGVIILPPYFEPLLVPADIEINIEQKSGKWDRSCTCSVCGQWRILESEKNSGKYKFCPNCGAKMESEEQTDAT